MQKKLKKLLAGVGVHQADTKGSVEIVNELCKRFGLNPGLEIFEKVAKPALAAMQAAEEVSPRVLTESLQKNLVAFHVKRNHRMQQKMTHTKIDVTSALVLANSAGSVFYSSPEWIRLRYTVLHKRGNVCEACGASPKTGAVIHIDHVEPRYLVPERALDESNLQVLCAACNIGKSHVFQTDWRKPREVKP